MEGETSAVTPGTGTVRCSSITLTRRENEYKSVSSERRMAFVGANRLYISPSFLSPPPPSPIAGSGAVTEVEGKSLVLKIHIEERERDLAVPLLSYSPLHILSSFPLPASLFLSPTFPLSLSSLLLSS